ncbi:long-chain fatty acid--CoA ligase [Streptomyces sp. S.PNR 29]|uniref:acyl-CoA synthetase n=1 Tax=Streptomyces sp. S.PNR 29 TaxID=2973805 RepID=UPI0025B0CFF5|nr:long-chain fatty acid--CoA ligase [Streptomyces sp. S.PNR 29]MDN0200024.1 long-chain fatty acid--CoA ligase [Streptomyces sp. S.PNR 29]
MPEVNISPALAVQHHALRQGDATALVYGPDRVSYAEFDAQTATLATLLAAGGVGRGERVTYLGLNSPALLATFLACARLGAVFVPVNHRLTDQETALVLNDCAPAALVVEDGRRKSAALAGQALVLPIGDQPGRPWLPASAADSGSAPAAQPTPLAAGDLAALLYTSGSTGRPKGVMLTQGNLWWNQVNVWSALDCRHDDTTLAVAPMFHIGGLNALTLGTLVRGGTVVVHRSFDAQQCLSDLQTHRVSGLFAVPAMFAALAALPQFAETDFSALRTAVVAGAPVPPSLINRYAQHGVLLQQAWGLTETAPFATYLPPRDTLAKLGSAGLPMPYTELRVVAPNSAGDDAGPDVRGELWVRGPNVTPGYWNSPEATEEAITADGWFRTGDVGYLDDEGYVYVVDRIKDMIITGGENVFPSEVEHVLTDLPGVAEAAVVGRPDDRWGEAVTAFVSLMPGTTEIPSLEGVRAFAGQRLARYKLPTELLIVDRIPRNGTGKMDKPLLRSQLTDRRTAVATR